MKININPDRNISAAISKAVSDNGGYCVCVVERNEDTKCMCKEFKEQLTPGYCHCELFYKEEE